MFYNIASWLQTHNNEQYANYITRLRFINSLMNILIRVMEPVCVDRIKYQSGHHECMHTHTPNTHDITHTI